jgi:hypothetical protein
VPPARDADGSRKDPAQPPYLPPGPSAQQRGAGLRATRSVAVDRGGAPGGRRRGVRRRLPPAPPPAAPEKAGRDPAHRPPRGLDVRPARPRGRGRPRPPRERPLPHRPPLPERLRLPAGRRNGRGPRREGHPHLRGHRRLRVPGPEPRERRVPAAGVPARARADVLGHRGGARPARLPLPRLVPRDEPPPEAPWPAHGGHRRRRRHRGGARRRGRLPLRLPQEALAPAPPGGAAGRAVRGRGPPDGLARPDLRQGRAADPGQPRRRGSPERAGGRRRRVGRPVRGEFLPAATRVWAAGVEASPLARGLPGSTTPRGGSPSTSTSPCRTTPRSTCSGTPPSTQTRSSAP